MKEKDQKNRRFYEGQRKARSSIVASSAGHKSGVQLANEVRRFLCGISAKH
jgi:hypothetical protein